MLPQTLFLSLPLEALGHHMVFVFGVKVGQQLIVILLIAKIRPKSGQILHKNLSANILHSYLANLFLRPEYVKKYMSKL
jgi:hypothetical protein